MTTAIIGTGGIGSVIARQLASGGENPCQRRPISAMAVAQSSRVDAERADLGGFSVDADVGSFQRSDLNAARISLLKSSGSSQAAKWPPFSTSLK